MTDSLIWQVVLALIGSGAVYGGIRADLRAIHERLKDVRESAAEAHGRIDSLLMGKGERHG